MRKGCNGAGLDFLVTTWVSDFDLLVPGVKYSVFFSGSLISHHINSPTPSRLAHASRTQHLTAGGLPVASATNPLHEETPQHRHPQHPRQQQQQQQPPFVVVGLLGEFGDRVLLLPTTAERRQAMGAAASDSSGEPEAGRQSREHLFTEMCTAGRRR